MVRSLARIDATNLVLDLGHVCRMDSYGVGQLVEVYNEVRSGGLTLELTNVEQHQKRLFELAGLLALIPVFEPRQETAEHPGDPTARRSGAERTDCQLDAA
jgi:anti-anti-sigma factor